PNDAASAEDRGADACKDARGRATQEQLPRPLPPGRPKSRGWAAAPTRGREALPSWRPMHVVLVVLLLIALLIGPGLWVKAVMRRYAEPGNRYPRNGGQLGRGLLDSAGRRDVRGGATDAGEHYDPRGRARRLSPGHLSSGSPP